MASTDAQSWVNHNKHITDKLEVCHWSTACIDVSLLLLSFLLLPLPSLPFPPHPLFLSSLPLSPYSSHFSLFLLQVFLYTTSFPLTHFFSHPVSPFLPPHPILLFPPLPLLSPTFLPPSSLFLPPLSPPSPPLTQRSC